MIHIIRRPTSPDSQIFEKFLAVNSGQNSFSFAGDSSDYTLDNFELYKTAEWNYLKNKDGTFSCKENYVAYVKGQKCFPKICPNGGSYGSNLFVNGDFQNQWNGWILPAGKGAIGSFEDYNSNWSGSACTVGVLDFNDNRNFAQSFNLKRKSYNLQFQYARRQGHPAA